VAPDMIHHARNSPFRGRHRSVLVVAVLSLLAHLLSPAIHTWHLCQEEGGGRGARPAGAILSATAGPVAQEAPTAPGCHHDEAACALCQSILAARLGVFEPTTPLLAVSPPAVSPPRCVVEAFKPLTADPVSRPPRGPPIA
jgi:hypothetical protein